MSGDDSDQIDWTGDWEIGWHRSDFEKLKSEPRFHALLTIARLRNMLRFTQGLIVHEPKDVSQNVSNRHSLNAFFLMNALLVEADRVIGGVARHFRRFAHYARLTDVVHRPKFKEVVKRSRPVRHWTVFHFFSKAAEQVIDSGYFSDLPDFVPFLSARGHLDFGIHSELADMVPFELMFGDIDRKDSNETFRIWLREASTATTDLIRAVDEFLAGMAHEFGATARQTPEAPPQ